jgi:hypothetical protein
MHEWSLVDGDQLEVEGEFRVGRNARQALATVCKLWWNDDSTLTTNGHALDSNVPTLNNRTVADLEAEWLAFLVRCRS